jgi:hypothetical protein
MTYFIENHLTKYQYYRYYGFKLIIYLILTQVKSINKLK